MRPKHFQKIRLPSNGEAPSEATLQRRIRFFQVVETNARFVTIFGVLVAFLLLLYTNYAILHERNERREKTNEAICAIIKAIPPGNPRIDAARKSFSCGAYVPPPISHPGSGGPSVFPQQPTSSSQMTPRASQSVSRRPSSPRTSTSPATVLQPAASSHARVAPTHSAHPRQGGIQSSATPRPRPSPTPTRPGAPSPPKPTPTPKSGGVLTPVLDPVCKLTRVCISLGGTK